MNQIEITKAHQDDILEIKKILSIVWDNTYKNIIPTNIIEEIKGTSHSINNLKLQINNPEIIFNLAKDNDKIVGILTAISQSKTYFLKRLYILPGMQGKGIGDKLLNDFINSNDIDKLILEVALDNLKAIKFYEKQGFIKASEKIDKILDFELKSLIMTKVFK